MKNNRKLENICNAGYSGLMIYEIKNVKQETDDELLRWFTDNEFWDLYTWNCELKPIHKFQIYFNRQVNEKGIIWDRVSGVTTARVSDDTTHFSPDRGSPVLYPEKVESQEVRMIHDKFDMDSTKVPEEIRTIVLSVLKEMI